MKKIRLIVTSVFAIFLSTALAASVAASPDPTTVYIDQPTITATSVGQEFTVTVYVKSVTDLYSWQIGMTWDPNRLECTAFTPIYSFFGPEGDTMLMLGTINNTAGEIFGPYACTFKYPRTTGVTGSGPLVSITFEAKATGTTNIHLAEIKLSDSSSPVPQVIPANMIDVYTIMWEGNPYPIVTVTNLTGLYPPFRYRLSSYAFERTWKIISFDTTGPDGETVFFNVTIPKALLEGNATYPWAIEVDDVDITAGVTKVENATHTSIYFTYTLSTHKVEIWVVPEFPAAMIVPILVIVTIVTAALGKTTYKTKHRG